MKPHSPAILQALPKPAITKLVAGQLATIFFALLIGGVALAQQKSTLLFLMSDNSGAYQTFKETLQNIKEEKNITSQEWLFIDLNNSSIQEIQNHTIESQIIISVGEPAAQTIASLDHKNRHITTFISKKTYKEIIEKYSKHKENTCGIIIDQPVERIISATREHINRFSRFGIIASTRSPRNKGKEIELYDASAVIYQPLIDDIHTTIKNISENQVDAIIATHDADIYNRHTARNILISSYHFNIPIIGYSSGFVRAGAIMGIYSKPESFAKDIHKIINTPEACANGTMFYPSTYTVEINKQVAKSLGINLLSTFREKTFNAGQ